MPLEVYTARINYGGPDRLDCTRKSGKEGLFLAPSWELLKPALEAMKAATVDMAEAKKDPGWVLYASEGAWSCFEDDEKCEDARRRINAAQRKLDTTWNRYVAGFKREMAQSQKTNPVAWQELLSLERIVLCCYCTDRVHCHRAVLRGDILPAMGAKDCGELT